MMDLKIYVENHGKKIVTIFILIDFKKEIKENTVFVMKAKKHMWKHYLRQNLFDYNTKL